VADSGFVQVRERQPNAPSVADRLHAAALSPLMYSCHDEKMAFWS